MHDLTQRQLQILKSIIEEYIETAEPVGSETIEKKHNLSASPATIRNEMVRLADLGYLQKPHASAGRIPTPKGMKLYVKELMREKELSTVEEVKLKEEVWDYRERNQRFLKEATKALADKTHTLAIATSHEGDIYCSGYSYILDMPEFYDIDLTRTLLGVVDEYDILQSVLTKAHADDEDIQILLGEDLAEALRGPYSVVYTSYETPLHQKGEIGVVGPVRLNYTSVIPAVRYFGDLIETVAKGW